MYCTIYVFNFFNECLRTKGKELKINKKIIKKKKLNGFQVN